MNNIPRNITITLSLTQAMQVKSCVSERRVMYDGRMWDMQMQRMDSIRDGKWSDEQQESWEMWFDAEKRKHDALEVIEALFTEQTHRKTNPFLNKDEEK